MSPGAVTNSASSCAWRPPPTTSPLSRTTARWNIGRARHPAPRPRSAPRRPLAAAHPMLSRHPLPTTRPSAPTRRHQTCHRYLPLLPHPRWPRRHCCWPPPHRTNHHSCDDWERAQTLAHGLSPDVLRRVLDRYARQCCPVLDVFAQSYHWSFMQVEYATDLVFRSPAILKPLYQQLSRQAILTVKA